jgi:Tfp pilus assembly protein PilN
MSTPLHLDLLKDTERFSSRPIRLRVILPMIAALAALCCLVWWALLGLRAFNQSDLRAGLKKNIQDQKAAHAIVLDLRTQQKETSAIIQHLGFYRHARLRFGETLARLPDLMPANIQITELRLPPPPPPLLNLQIPTLGPTNTLEQVTLRLAGRTVGDSKASESVNALLASLRTPAFTNLIQQADIPKGAFRQDVGRNPDNRETLLFEIRCVCLPRRFE